MSLPFHALLDDLQQPGLRRLAAHWLDLYRQTGAVPALRNLDPLGFSTMLKHVWIVETGDDGQFRIRLAGEILTEWYGTNPKGRSFKEMFSPQMLPLLNAIARRVIDGPSATWHRMRTTMPQRSEPAGFERLALPMTGTDGRVRYIFGATVFDDPLDNGRGGLQTVLEREVWYGIPAPVTA